MSQSPRTTAAGGTAARDTADAADHRPRTVTGRCVTELAERLAAAGGEGRHEVLRRFWTEVGRRGTPLVEPAPDEPHRSDVTFLWRGSAATRRVLLLANRLADRRDFASSLLSHLPGTDVWHFTYRLRDDHRSSYTLAEERADGPDRPADDDPGPEEGREELQERLRLLAGRGCADPLNPHRMPQRWRAAESSLFALPEAPAAPTAPTPPAAPTRPRRGTAARGALERLPVPTAALGGHRDVWTYLPPGGIPGPPRTLVLCDGDMWFGRLGLHRTLDTLVADGAVPPLAVVSPGAVDAATRWSELTARDAYLDFLTEELLPWVEDRLLPAAEPRRTAVAGQSLGGLTALYAGLTRPRRFGTVLAQSPSLWWRPGMAPTVPRTATAGPPWLASVAADRPVEHPLDVRIDVGLHEPGMAGNAAALRDALRRAGHRVDLAAFNGGHDYACWRVHLVRRLAAGPGR